MKSTLINNEILFSDWMEDGELDTDAGIKDDEDETDDWDVAGEADPEEEEEKDEVEDEMDDL